jgi:HAMP domain-containing protein
MSTATPSPKTAPAGGPYQRSWKNYLLLRDFQLKYTAYIVVIASVLSAVLGLFIYTRTQEAFLNAQEALTSAKAANDEARAASKMLKMDEMFADPEAGKAAVDQEDLKYAQKADELEAKLKKQAAEAYWTPFVLGGVLGALVLALSVFGIIITHRVAGPLFVMSRTFSNIASGDYRIGKRALRKGDELADIFQKSIDALQALNDRSRETLQEAQRQLEILRQLKDKGADPALVARVEEAFRAVASQSAKQLGEEKPSTFLGTGG